MPSGFHTWSATAANDATADSAINWAEGQSPSSVNDSARAMMSVLAKWRDDNNGSLTTGGTSTAFTLTTNTVFTTLALMANQTLSFTMNATSGATPTLNVDGLGAKAIRNATGVALPTGALLSGSVYHATYNNSSGEWLLQNQPAVLPTNSVATASISDDAVTFAKLLNATGAALIGKNDAGSGDFKEITLGGGLSFSGTTLVSTLDPAVLPGYLSGLELSTAGSSATFGVAVGGCNDAAQGGMMALTSAYTKTTSAWTLGSGNGGLDTSTIASNTWYHVFLIKRADTGVVDVLFSLSATAPTMPTNYTLKRRIGSMKTNGSSQWTKFTQVGDTFIWDTSVLDYNNGAQTSVSRTLTTLSVPTGFNVTATFRASISATTQTLRIASPLESDVAVTAANCSLVTATSTAADFRIVTNTSAQIGHRAAGASAAGLNIDTYGWIDQRGK